MLNISFTLKLKLLVFHILLGIILYNFRFLGTYIGLATVIIAIYYISSYSDPIGILPILFSSYIVGLEVLLRMTKASLFWEFGKYSILLFFIIGIYRNRIKLNYYFPIIIYIILLLPSIIMLPLDSLNQWRQDVSFNLSGPIVLTCSVIYMNNRRINNNILNNILLFMVLPVVSIATYNVLMMPDLTSYHFLPYSNPETSGGYGPNQVSTIFGLGISVILISQTIRLDLFGKKYINYIMLFIFIGLGLITFSRGGIFSAIIAFTIAISYYMFRDQKGIYTIAKGISFIIVVTLTWYLIVSTTDGVISQRYGLGESSYNEKLILDLSGRAEIYKIDINIFKDYLLTGVGPGQAYELRQIYGYGKIVAAHTEYSRMLAEHGILGLFSLGVLIMLPFYHFLIPGTKNGKYFKIFIGLLALLTMSHSAMRLAMPCFTYGLIFLNYDDTSNSKFNNV